MMMMMMMMMMMIGCSKARTKLNSRCCWRAWQPLLSQHVIIIMLPIKP
jgi:hypothetical protein